MATASTSYVQRFVEDISELPVSLKRKFALMRELDEKAHNLKEQIQAAAQQQISSLAGSSGAPPEAASEASMLGDNIEAQIQQLLQYEDEKVALAVQLYSNVDNHIKSLDLDLVALKAEMQKEQAAGGGVNRGGRPKGGGGKKSSQGGASSGAGASKAQSGSGDASGPSELDSPLLPDMAGHVIDSNEPVYCHCQRVSFGEMIGCDNEDCPIEWFHYACVGISADNVPDEWYCDDCKKLKDAGKI